MLIWPVQLVGVYFEELVGLDQETKYETLWQALMQKCFKNYKGTPKGGVATPKWPNQRLIQQEM